MATTRSRILLAGLSLAIAGLVASAGRAQELRIIDAQKQGQGRPSPQGQNQLLQEQSRTFQRQVIEAGRNEAIRRSSQGGPEGEALIQRELNKDAARSLSGPSEGTGRETTVIIDRSGGADGQVDDRANLETNLDRARDFSGRERPAGDQTVIQIDVDPNNPPNADAVSKFQTEKARNFLDSEGGQDTTGQPVLILRAKGGQRPSNQTNLQINTNNARAWSRGSKGEDCIAATTVGGISGGGGDVTVVTQGVTDINSQRCAK